MASTRILAVDVPRLLGEVLGGIVSGHDGLEIVAETDREGMFAAAAEHQPNVVMLCVDAAEADAIMASLWARHPRLCIVTIHDEGRRATAYIPGSPPREAIEVSPSALVEMLSQVVH